MADTFALGGAISTATATGLGFTSGMAIGGAGVAATAGAIDFRSSIDIAGAGAAATAGPIDTSGGAATFAVGPAFRSAKAQGLKFH